MLPRAFDIDEGESGYYLATITGNDGQTMLPASTLLTLQLTLYAILQNGTEQIINTRNAQNILNANNGAVFETLQTDVPGRTYNLRWTIQVADTTLVEAIPYERHIALFEWTWAGGAGKHEVVLVVRALRQVP